MGLKGKPETKRDSYSHRGQSRLPVHQTKKKIKNLLLMILRKKRKLYIFPFSNFPNDNIYIPFGKREKIFERMENNNILCMRRITPILKHKYQNTFS